MMTSMARNSYVKNTYYVADINLWYKETETNHGRRNTLWKQTQQASFYSPVNSYQAYSAAAPLETKGLPKIACDWQLEMLRVCAEKDLTHE